MWEGKNQWAVLILLKVVANGCDWETYAEMPEWADTYDDDEKMGWNTALSKHVSEEYRWCLIRYWLVMGINLF